MELKLVYDTPYDFVTEVYTYSRNLDSLPTKIPLSYFFAFEDNYLKANRSNVIIAKTNFQNCYHPQLTDKVLGMCMLLYIYEGKIISIGGVYYTIISSFDNLYHLQKL